MTTVHLLRESSGSGSSSCECLERGHAGCTEDTIAPSPGFESGSIVVLSVTVRREEPLPLWRDAWRPVYFLGTRMCSYRRSRPALSRRESGVLLGTGNRKAPSSCFHFPFSLQPQLLMAVCARRPPPRHRASSLYVWPCMWGVCVHMGFVGVRGEP